MDYVWAVVLLCDPAQASPAMNVKAILKRQQVSLMTDYWKESHRYLKVGLCMLRQHWQLVLPDLKPKMCTFSCFQSRQTSAAFDALQLVKSNGVFIAAKKRLLPKRAC